MVRKRRQRREELNQKRSEEFDAQMRQALGEFAAAVEVRLQAESERARATQATLVEAVSTMKTEIAARDGELAIALEKLGRILDRTGEAIEDDRHERRALVDALVQLAQSVGDRDRDRDRPNNTISLPRAERIVGGTVYGSADIELVPDLDDTDGGGAYVRRQVEAVPNIAGLEVQCRFGGDWVDGFEVFDVIQEGSDLRYRLRRLSDGSIPSKLFDVSEVRPKHDTAPHDPPPSDSPRDNSSAPRRTWSRPEWV